jgi:hypothetical protein
MKRFTAESRKRFAKGERREHATEEKGLSIRKRRKSATDGLRWTWISESCVECGKLWLDVRLAEGNNPSTLTSVWSSLVIFIRVHLCSSVAYFAFF